MARKLTGERNRREEIITAALNLFFTKGFEGTSVRTIMKHVGAEVGLFYYYFDNKDDVFDHVLDRFFSHYDADFKQIVEHGRRNPCRVMYNFFTYMEEETEKFREKYAQNMHRTVRWAIREHTLEIIEPHIREVVDIQSNYYGVAPALDPDVAALYLTHGVGSSILHEDHKKYIEKHNDIQQGTCLIMNMSKEEQQLRIPYHANENDIKEWMTLAEETKDYFPGMDLEELQKELKQRIEKKEAWVFRYEDKVVAGAFYSKENQSLDYLSVYPDFRRKGMAHRLVETIAACFPVETTLSVVTFSENEEKGVAARAFYQALGFKEVQEVQMFGETLSKMELIVKDRV